MSLRSIHPQRTGNTTILPCQHKGATCSCCGYKNAPCNRLCKCENSEKFLRFGIARNSAPPVKPLIPAVPITVPPHFGQPTTLLANPSDWHDTTPGTLTPDGRGKFSMPIIRPNEDSVLMPAWPGASPGFAPSASPYVPQVAPMEGSLTHSLTPDGRGKFFLISD